MNTNYKKVEITKAVLAQLPTTSEPIDKIIGRWWMTKSSEQGLRLTGEGDIQFRQAEIEFFNFPLPTAKNPTSSWQSFILDCSKKLKCPYYFGPDPNNLTQKKQLIIRLYDSKIAMLVQLYGDIQSYLESVRIRR